MAALVQLSSGVAHELNNPLTAAVGLVDLLLEDEPKGTEKREDLKTIRDECMRCGKIIQDLLQFARQARSNKKRERINDLVERSLKAAGDPKSLPFEIVKDLAAGLPDVAADGARLEQAFAHIIDNARRAMKDSAHPRLAVKTEAVGGRVRIVFSDNGCGMTEEVLKRIFNPFFTTREVGQGTGLGLSVSRGIVKDHGGQIHVRSALFKGSTFTVELPTL